jgi:hypothetical protein
MKFKSCGQNGRTLSFRAFSSGVKRKMLLIISSMVVYYIYINISLNVYIRLKIFLAVLSYYYKSILRKNKRIYNITKSMRVIVTWRGITKKSIRFISIFRTPWRNRTSP